MTNSISGTADSIRVKNHQFEVEDQVNNVTDDVVTLFGMKRRCAHFTESDVAPLVFGGCMKPQHDSCNKPFASSVPAQ